jgi:hypothetical protein
MVVSKIEAPIEYVPSLRADRVTDDSHGFELDVRKKFIILSLGSLDLIHQQ